MRAFSWRVCTSRRTTEKCGHSKKEAWGIRGIDDVAGLPLIMLLVGAYFFVLTPVTNTFTRTFEIEADRFGLEVARQPEGMAEAALKRPLVFPPRGGQHNRGRNQQRRGRPGNNSERADNSGDNKENVKKAEEQNAPQNAPQDDNQQRERSSNPRRGRRGVNSRRKPRGRLFHYSYWESQTGASTKQAKIVIANVINLKS